MKTDQRGFTLMELMIVIVIIGVLAAIGIPAYNNYTKKARETACTANMRSIATAVGLYYAETGKYPADGPIGDRLKTYLDNAGSLKCPLSTSEAVYNYAIGHDDTDVVFVTCSNDLHKSLKVVVGKGVQETTP